MVLKSFVHIFFLSSHGTILQYLKCQHTANIKKKKKKDSGSGANCVNVNFEGGTKRSSEGESYPLFLASIHIANMEEG